MSFINPKTDFAFKKIFGSEQSKDILLSFLNSILYNNQPTIVDLDILNPYQPPQIRGSKYSYLDIKAKITGNKTVIIEMQLVNATGFEKRILYNTAKAYCLQIAEGEDYRLLNPVIALTIVNFKLFSDLEKMVSRFVLKEKEELRSYLSNDFELIFVELPKFNKKLEELKTLTDKWIYFLKEADKLRTIPQVMREIPELSQAFTLANEANMSEEELDDLRRRALFINDRRNEITKAKSEGKAELVLTLLTAKWGSVAPEIQTTVSNLSGQELDALAKEILNFQNEQDLLNYIALRAGNGE